MGDRPPFYADWMKSYAEETLEELTDMELNTQALAPEVADRFKRLFREAQIYHLGSKGWFIHEIGTDYGLMYRVLINTTLGDVCFGLINLPGLPPVYFFGLEDRLMENMPAGYYDLEVTGLQGGFWEEAYGFPSSGMDNLQKRILKHLPAYQQKTFH